MRPFPRIASCAVIVLLALVFRLPQLEQRTMHGDEAVHAIKFGELLEEGTYRYDPNEYHGPTLNYLTLISAWVLSQFSLTDTTEFTLRIVPVFFGTLLVWLVFLFQSQIGRPAALLAATITAISPAMVFYSRYYIQEVLLVFFTTALFCIVYRFFRRPKASLAFWSGVFLGLMYATKETFILPLGAAFIVWMVSPLVRGKPLRSLIQPVRSLTGLHAVFFVTGFVATSVLLFTSFFSNPEGLLDSFKTYLVYLDRAGAEGEHNHPWYYYLRLLLFSQFADGPVWSEALILVLAGAGITSAFWRQKLPGQNSHWQRFLSLFAVILTVLYSVIPYKTPWNALLFLQAMILLAGTGGLFLLRLLSGRTARHIIALLLLAGLVHLGWQSYRASFVYYEDSRNPYVYAHPVADVLAISKRISEIAQVHPTGDKMTINVISPGHDYWPFPWYLRRFHNVGWWDHVDNQVQASQVILASPEVDRSLLKALYELPEPGKRNLFVPLFANTMFLRPAVEIRGYVRSDLWDRFQRVHYSYQASPELFAGQIPNNLQTFTHKRGEVP